MKTKTNLLPFDGEVYYFPSVFSSDLSDRLFKELHDEIVWKHEPIQIFGKSIMQPRLTAWYGDQGKSYSYSGITMQPHPWNQALIEIKRETEAKTHINFNSALLNLYRNENDGVGWHRDNEKELGINPVIGSVSFGATREFQFQYVKDRKIKKSILLEHGSILFMQGETQHKWLHSVPKKSLSYGPRINITFRVVKSV